MGHWLTIEVQHAVSSAYRWRGSWADALLEAALTHGVRDWAWQTPDWGVILELEFSSEDNRDAFPGLPLVRAALGSAPEAVLGVSSFLTGAAPKGLGCGGGPGRHRSLLVLAPKQTSRNAW